ncbi:hypothetical protein N7526_007967 [Penicillium atrosanguineum]|nr:hypothetical protein N7526_007967 [Penicillium atrosanguineum]
MPYPPPPGLKQTPSSLPPRPPPSNNAAQPVGHGNARQPGYNAFTAFAPRSVASSQPRASNATVSAPPSYSAGYAGPAAPAVPATTYGNYQQQTYQSGPSFYGAQYGESASPAVPHIQNPFGSTPPTAQGRNGIDPETEAQIAQWQSAYANQNDDAARKASNTGTTTGTGTPIIAGTPIPQSETQKTVQRAGGGQAWTDSTLLEWDPAHFRLFVGNLAGEVTDDSLLKAFARYTSVQKARVIREKRTQKSKGFGFVSFSDGDDYFSAAREMQGKYIGSHPILLRRATTEVKPVSNNKNQKKNGGGARGQPGGKVKHDGVKKSGKTKGGLKILG